MTLREANNFFESLKDNTFKKPEVIVYEELLHILSKLKTREFSKGEIKSIETELDRFNLETNFENRKKHYSKLLKGFKDYLKEKHSLVSEGHYTQFYITTGSALGIVAGIIIGERFEKSLGIALGIGIGMLIGLFVGRSMDAKAKSDNRIL